MMIKGQDPENIKFGNSFSDDGHRGVHFDYLLANPPFGVEWKKVEGRGRARARDVGRRVDGSAPGLPRINDGSLLFLQHMISKMKPVTADGKGGSRIAIVFNGSPLFTGAADSGESRIRRWIIENDWLEGIVALPDQLFYNTGISTYFWILTNRKAPGAPGQGGTAGRPGLLGQDAQVAGRQEKVRDVRSRSPRSPSSTARRWHVAQDPEHALHAKVKVFDNDAFGYQRITVERPLKLRFEVSEEALASAAAAKVLDRFVDVEPFVGALKPLLGQSWPAKRTAWDALRTAVADAGVLWSSATPFQKALRDVFGVRDPDGEVQLVKGKPEPDPDLRDYENVPLGEDVEEYLRREVLPHVPDAWIDHDKTKIGYEIPFTRHFYVYKPPRPLAEIDAELKALEAEIQSLLTEVTE